MEPENTIFLYGLLFHAAFIFSYIPKSADFPKVEYLLGELIVYGRALFKEIIIRDKLV